MRRAGWYRDRTDQLLGKLFSRCPCPCQLSGSAHCTHSADMSLPSPSLPWQNLNGVMVAVAELLSMKIPNSYEVLFPESPARAGNEHKKGEAEGPGECGRKTP